MTASAALRPAAAKAMPAPGPVRARVLILTVGSGTGGAENLIRMTAPRLRDAGFAVTVAALKEGRGAMAAGVEAAGVPFVSFGGRARYDPRALVRLRRALLAGRYDILHAHLFLANVAARVAGHFAGVPVVITSHHDTDLWMRAPHRLVERLTAKWSDRIVTCSEAVRRYAIERHGLPAARVRTLRNAIEVPAAPAGEAERAAARRDLGADDGDIVIATLGRLDEPKKGLAIFLEAAATVAAAEPRARFALVGDGPARADLERQAETRGLGGRLVFAGERRDVFGVLAGVDIFVQPSLWEGFGLTVIEAMAAARPVVASRVGGVPEALRDGVDGLLVPPGEPAALAQAILRLARDPDLRGRFGSAGRARARSEFGLDGLVDATIAMYDELLATGRPRTRPMNATTAEERR
jgi:glycosyltransferase involved in cell wall biosynthesis